MRPSGAGGQTCHGASWDGADRAQRRGDRADRGARGGPALDLLERLPGDAARGGSERGSSTSRPYREIAAELKLLTERRAQARQPWRESDESKAGGGATMSDDPIAVLERELVDAARRRAGPRAPGRPGDVHRSRRATRDCPVGRHRAGDRRRRGDPARAAIGFHRPAQRRPANSSCSPSSASCDGRRRPPTCISPEIDRSLLRDRAPFVAQGPPDVSLIRRAAATPWGSRAVLRSRRNRRVGPRWPRFAAGSRAPPAQASSRYRASSRTERVALEVVYATAVAAAQPPPTSRPGTTWRTRVRVAHSRVGHRRPGSCSSCPTASRRSTSSCPVSPRPGIHGGADLSTRLDGCRALSTATSPQSRSAGS